MPEKIPLGHCLDEYTKMFSLTKPSDLDLKILDCAGGTASFNAEMTRQGKKVISCDPYYYQRTPVEIHALIQETYHTVIDFPRELYAYGGKNYFESEEHLAKVRRNAMLEFLEDFPSGLQQGRYVNASLPDLPFNDDQFDLALCSHFLFTYPHSSENFPLAAITEMCRVAKEVRVFPLLDRFGGISEHLNPLRTILNRSFHVETPVVNYEFQIGGNEMLRVSKKSSA
jgi:SAM-dependent methyltransferase